MDKIEFPVGTCPECSVRGPLFITNIDMDMVDEGAIGQIEVIVCPECDIIINSDKDFEVEWFDIDQAKYFGYKVVDNE